MSTLDRAPSRNHRPRSTTAPWPINTASLLTSLEGRFDSTTVLKAHRWGENLAREADAWRLIQVRRHDGFSVEQIARRIADECGVSMEYARLASRYMNGGRDG